MSGSEFALRVQIGQPEQTMRHNSIPSTRLKGFLDQYGRLKAGLPMWQERKFAVSSLPAMRCG
jgi:hypothetical protein